MPKTSKAKRLARTPWWAWLALALLVVIGVFAGIAAFGNLHSNPNGGGTGNGGTHPVIDEDGMCDISSTMFGCEVETCGNLDASNAQLYVNGDGDSAAIEGASRAFPPLGGKRRWNRPSGEIISATMRSGAEVVKDRGDSGISLTRSGEGSDVAYSVEDCDGKVELANRGAVVDHGVRGSGKLADRTWLKDPNDGVRKYLQYPDFVSHNQPGDAVYAPSSTYANQAFDMVTTSFGFVGLGETYPENFYRAGRFLARGKAIFNDDGDVVVGNTSAILGVTPGFPPIGGIREYARTTIAGFTMRSGMSCMVDRQGLNLQDAPGLGTDISYEWRDDETGIHEVANAGVVRPAGYSNDVGRMTFRTWNNGKYTQLIDGKKKYAPSSTSVTQLFQMVIDGAEGRVGINEDNPGGHYRRGFLTVSGRPVGMMGGEDDFVPAGSGVTGYGPGFAPISGIREWNRTGVPKNTLRSGILAEVDVGTGTLEDGIGPDIAMLIHNDATGEHEIANFGAIRSGHNKSGRIVARTWRQGLYTQRNPETGMREYQTSTTWPDQEFQLVINEDGQVGINTDEPEDSSKFGRTGRLVVDGTRTGVAGGSPVAVPDMAAILGSSPGFPPTGGIRDRMNAFGFTNDQKNRRRINSAFGAMNFLDMENGIGPNWGAGPDISFENRDQDGTHEIANVGATNWFNSVNDAESGVNLDSGRIVFRNWVDGKYYQHSETEAGPFKTLASSTTFRFQNFSAVITGDEGGRLGVNQDFPECTVHAGRHNIDTDNSGDGDGFVGGDVCADGRIRIDDKYLSNDGGILMWGNQCVDTSACAKKRSITEAAEVEGLNARVVVLEKQVAEQAAMLEKIMAHIEMAP